MGASLRPKLVPLYEQMANLIEADIRQGRLRPSQRIHSIREACVAFGVSEVTAKQAFRLLLRRGLIHSVKGKGIFVADAPGATKQDAQDRTIVAFVKARPHLSPIFAYEVDLIQQELEKRGCFMIYSATETEEDVPKVLERIVSSSGAKCLLHFPAHAVNYDDAPYRKALQQSGLPVLVVESPSRKDSYVMADVEQAAQDLTDYLYELGHRRICLATDFPRKVAGFQKAIEKRKDPSLQHWVLGEPGRSEDALRDLAGRILSLPNPPTAILASNDLAAAVLVRDLLHRGVKVPEDVSVTAFDDHPVLSRESPVALTVAAHPAHEVAREVGVWVQRALQGGRTAQRRFRRGIVGRLVVRASAAPPR